LKNGHPAQLDHRAVPKFVVQLNRSSHRRVRRIVRFATRDFVADEVLKRRPVLAFVPLACFVVGLLNRSGLNFFQV
jgi:hypothetical protein